MSTTPESKKLSVPASLPFLILGVLSICSAAVMNTVLQLQHASLETPILNVLIYGGLGIMVLGGVADAVMDRINSKKADSPNA